MITSTEAVNLVNQYCPKGESWLTIALRDLEVIIREQIKIGNTIFYISRKENYNKNSVYDIFDDSSKMSLLCKELCNNGFFVRASKMGSGNKKSVLKINCYEDEGFVDVRNPEKKEEYV